MKNLFHKTIEYYIITKMNKRISIFNTSLILFFLFFFFSFPVGKKWGAANAIAQNVTVEIDGDDLYYFEPGCADCLGDPDPRWNARAITPSGQYDWNVSIDGVCGWAGVNNLSLVTPQTQLSNAAISMSMNGKESDGFLCGSDDNVCSGYTTIETVIIDSFPPCQWNYFISQKTCGSGTYAIEWSYYYFYQSLLPGSIAIVDDTICAGENPDSISSVTDGTLYANMQWQYSDDNGLTWIDITGATGLNYDPPAGIIITRWYRRKASSCGGVADVFSNNVTITVLPKPVATATPSIQTICSGDIANVLLTSDLVGTSFVWSVIETNPLGAAAGSTASINQVLTNNGIITDTATYKIVPTLGQCSGDTISSIVIVNPLPIMGVSPLSLTICSGDTTSILLSSNLPSTTFNWTVFQSAVTGGMLGSDSLSIAQILTATGTTAGTAIYLIKPLAKGCFGAPVSYPVTVNPSDDASFTYTSATYCQSGANPTPIITGLLGGTFTSSPVGLSINAVSGEIILANSFLNTYNLCYLTNGTCPISSCISMTIINSNPSSSFSYPATNFCQNGNNPFPIFDVGASAGIFSSSPAGLVFAHVNTGEIDLSASTPGTYTVVNLIPVSGTCSSVTTSTSITILPSDDASFTYPSVTYCTSGANPSPSITGLAGGYFYASPSGLAIDSVTGTINLAASLLGSYTLSYTTNGTCPNSSSVTMTITNITPDAAFTYLGSSYCQDGINPFPYFNIGASAGSFSSSPVGLVFVNTNTGEIDLLGSLAGSYVVTNNIPASGSCTAATANFSFVIIAPDDASFLYSSATYCKSGLNQLPAITGLPGGVFSATPAGLSINSATGEINLSLSTLGVYILSYTTNGTCPQTSFITMTIINASPNATFNYSSASFCQNGANPSPIFNAGASAGIFSAIPSGLDFVHLNTGEIDLSSSLPGNYTVTNNIPISGSCAAVSFVTTVIITPSDDASFFYPSATYCTSGINPSPTITGLAGGNFSSSPVGLVIDNLTGIINLSLSSLGAYQLSYTTNGTCPNTSSILLTIADSTNPPDATFIYAGSPYCQNAINALPTFTSSSAGIFSASPVGLIFSHVNTGEIDLTLSTPGTYSVTNNIPASGSCIAATYSSSIIINPAPVITATPPLQSICNGNATSIVLGSSIGSTATSWTIIQTGVNGASAGSGPIIVQTLTNTGSNQGIVNYLITSIAGTCIGAPISVTVSVNQLPVADTAAIIIRPANCGGPTGEILNITMASGLAPFQYVWKNSAGLVVGTISNLSGVISGVYTLTVTDANSCSITVGSFYVPTTPPIIAQFTANPITGETPLSVTFTNNSIGAATYLWQFGTGDSSNLMNPVYIYQPLGVFKVCLTAISATGCIDSTCSEIDIYLNSVFIVPNIFTPNNDNFNDIFSVVGIGLTKMNAVVFNRWGQKQYEWNTVSGGWDGRSSSGVDCADGTYYYILYATGIDGKEYSQKGFFNLIRSK